MKICIIGKYPPIEGGVSMHTYWYARALASAGHEVHIVTNAKDVEINFRMFMRPIDWDQCQIEEANGGKVAVHWAEIDPKKAFHIPSTSLSATKLAGFAATIIREYDLECIFSYYLEPYGVAGWVAAEITGIPHIVKHAGSDIGRLAKIRQLEPIYFEVFRRAATIISRGVIKASLVEKGIPAEKFWERDSFKVPFPFSPTGQTLDIQGLIDEVQADASFRERIFGSSPLTGPIIGAYGKIGHAKGTDSLLRAARILKDRGLCFSLIFVGSSFPERDHRFRELVIKLGLTDRILQLPFLPHWRIPEFIRRCDAVCFLEHDFPIHFHAPTVPREILACGRVLICSEEVLSRQIFARFMINGYNCVSIANVNDIQLLATEILGIIQDPSRCRSMGAAGNDVSLRAEASFDFPENYVNLFTGNGNGGHLEAGQPDLVSDTSRSDSSTINAALQRFAAVANEKDLKRVARHRMNRSTPTVAQLLFSGASNPSWVPRLICDIQMVTHDRQTSYILGCANSRGQPFCLEVSRPVAEIVQLIDGKRNLGDLCTVGRHKHNVDEQNVLYVMREMFVGGVISLA